MIYRPPNTDQKYFLQWFKKLVNSKKQYNCKDFVIGMDHNLDLLKHHQHSNIQAFMELMLDNFIMPSITKPTRIIKETATLIDNMCLSCELHAKQLSGIIISDLGDHLPCISIISNCKGTQKEITQKRRKFNNKNIEKIKNSLNKIDWKTILAKNGVNKSTLLFHDKVIETLDKFAPEQIEMIPAKRVIGQPWMTKGLLNCAKKQLSYIKDLCLPKISTTKKGTNNIAMY